jgi:hypothetical protein
VNFIEGKKAVSKTSCRLPFSAARNFLADTAACSSVVPGCVKLHHFHDFYAAGDV